MKFFLDSDPNDIDLKKMNNNENVNNNAMVLENDEQTRQVRQVTSFVFFGSVNSVFPSESFFPDEFVDFVQSALSEGPTNHSSGDRGLLGS